MCIRDSMYISDFARLGQVSVRMLRHYDELGLLRPDHVDPWTGYRSYSPEQLHVLNRLVALKAVSYTHLDVYKRQTWVCSERCLL